MIEIFNYIILIILLLIINSILKKFNILINNTGQDHQTYTVREKIPLKKISNAEMINLIGNQIEPYRKNLELNDNQFFFDYLKKEIKEKRKMGHITILK